MDIHMPVLDGISATREIRKGSESVKDIPIVGVTASVMKEETESYLEAGMNAVVAKPIEINKLMDVIYELL
jgi:CheY-like chemotaxis protein